MAYVHADDAVGPAASARSAGGPTLTLAAGKGAAFAAADPTPSSPMPVALFRGPTGSEVLQGAVLVTGVSGDALTCAGNVPGYVDPAVQAGDVAACVPLAADDAALWAAIATCVTSTALATTLAGYVTTSALTAALASYATTSALTSGLAGKQATLTAGSIATSLLADSGVTTVKLNDKAVTYGKLADAAGAGLLGATAAGAHQLLTIGAGLALTGSTLSAPAGATRWSMIWTTGAYGRTAVGAIDPRPRRARAAATPVRLMVDCPASGAYGCSIQITVNGTNLLASALTLASGATSGTATSFALATIPLDAIVMATATAMDGSTRGVVVELVLQESS